MAERVSIPDTWRWEVWNRDNFTCRCCGSRMYLVIDHVIPISKGGQNTLRNFQTLCQQCNSRKRDHDDIVFLGERCESPTCTCAGKFPAVQPVHIEHDDELIASAGSELPLDL